MEIIPAIDLRGGKCVRLYQGDYSRETIFSEDPVSVAKHWQSLGAKRIHVVDLDGAAQGEVCHTSTISDIAGAVNVPVQMGGGIRTLDTIESVMGIGVERVILGTAAIENQSLIEQACERFGNGIIAGVDARNGYVATRGWVSSSEVTATDLVERMKSIGVQRFVYTDISRDGTLTEPNFDAISELISKTGVTVIAAGGISSVEHLQKLSKTGVEGAIVGRALYTGHIDLKRALESIV
ncbi:MAG: 1-(5-phosphoribosyl)-5-[(5-phosphoribosylamino)methylideneamino]imidazole-4-carboxamide isomerase [Chloroflexota bacterium]|nr:1-(5-phosphoribosyl)-5-[(5-phosphoribosylamino)methylideneamino]imidazole-4-carboxamide isomerase [Chloroflexota bacterium]